MKKVLTKLLLLMAVLVLVFALVGCGGGGGGSDSGNHGEYNEQDEPYIPDNPVNPPSNKIKNRSLVSGDTFTYSLCHDPYRYTGENQTISYNGKSYNAKCIYTGSERNPFLNMLWVEESKGGRMWFDNFAGGFLVGRVFPNYEVSQGTTWDFRDDGTKAKCLRIDQRNVNGKAYKAYWIKITYTNDYGNEESSSYFYAPELGFYDQINPTSGFLVDFKISN